MKMEVFNNYCAVQQGVPGKTELSQPLALSLPIHANHAMVLCNK
jgi:hypothetical protein